MATRTFAVILGAGAGTRLRSETPKQFCTLAGRGMIEYAFETFDRHDAITDIILVVPAAMTAQERAIIDRMKAAAMKTTLVVTGGATRNLSTRNALDMILDDEAKVLVHDAARPLLQADIICRCVDALASYDAVDVVIECADTIVEVDDFDCIKSIPRRATLRQGQTPQGFRVGVLRDAYDKATKAGSLDNSDDCTIVLHHLPHVTIKCVKGSENNLKVTRPIDLVTANRLFQLRSASHLEIDAGKTIRPLALDSRIIVVFGSSSGIGRETMVMARDAGATVRGFSLTDGNVDIRDQRAVARVLRDVQDELGRIDAIINTVGILNRGPLSEQTVATIKDTLDINLLGAFLVAREAMAYLRATRGQLIFFTSSSYTRGRPTYAAYSAAKAGLVNMVQALSDELAGDGIRVNCINPERTATRMRSRAFFGEDQNDMLQATDVARVTLSLIDAPLTGQVIDVTRDQKNWSLDRPAGVDAAPMVSHRGKLGASPSMPKRRFSALRA